MSEQIAKLLSELAVKLGVTAEYLWTVLVKGQYAIGITYAVESVLWSIVLIASAVYLKKFVVIGRKEDRYHLLYHWIDNICAWNSSMRGWSDPTHNDS